MLGYVDSYYKSQMNRFLKLKDDLVNEDIKVLERVLYTLNTAKTYKIQNRFLHYIRFRVIQLLRRLGLLCQKCLVCFI